MRFLSGALIFILVAGLLVGISVALSGPQPLSPHQEMLQDLDSIIVRLDSIDTRLKRLGN